MCPRSDTLSKILTTTQNKKNFSFFCSALERWFYCFRGRVIPTAAPNSVLGAFSYNSELRAGCPNVGMLSYTASFILNIVQIIHTSRQIRALTKRVLKCWWTFNKQDVIDWLIDLKLLAMSPPNKKKKIIRRCEFRSAVRKKNGSRRLK